MEGANILLGTKKPSKYKGEKILLDPEDIQLEGVDQSAINEEKLRK